jgi:hypothetical protein
MQQNLYDQQPFQYQLLSHITVRIMAGVQPRTSCTSLCKQLATVLVPYQYVHLLMNFISSNQEHF